MATDAYSERPDVLAYRVNRNSDAIRELADWRRDVDKERATTKEQVGAMREDIVALTAGFDSLRRTLLGFAFTIAGSAIVFALAILAATR